MVYQLSAGVNVSEIDLSTVVPSVGTTQGAFAGDFAWGPVGIIVPIADVPTLVNTFGQPNSSTYIPFFTCYNFLSYANSLQVVRQIGSTSYNATANSGGTLLIKNRYDYEVNHLAANGQLNFASSLGMFAARYPGAIGNSLKVSCWPNSNSAAWTSWGYYSSFNGPPSTSSYAANLGSANDEMHIIVIDENGLFTGVANTTLERFSYVSKASDATNDDGTSNYWINVLKDRSKYIVALNNAISANGAAETTTWGKTAASQTTFAQNSNLYEFSLSGGTDALSASGDLISAYGMFANPDVAEISLLMTGAHPNTVVSYAIQSISGVRKDNITFLSPRQTDVVFNAGNEAASCVAYRNQFNSSSYAFMDGNWKYQFDPYNNVYRWVPLNGDIAGLCVATDFSRDPWYSPAGLNRGQINNVVKLAWNPTQADRDTLYTNSINPVVSFPGDGVVLYGDKTLLAKPSAFDRINVRRLFIVLEKSIKRAARYSLFEFNDAFTRAQFVSIVEPFLRDVQGRRGIYDFRVVCDTTNNTPQVIDSNQFVGDIYIKPARSINFIQLNFVAVGTGVSFSEIVGQF